MIRPRVCLIAAVGRSGQIGLDGRLPWGNDFPEDRREFRRKTAGGILLAGYRTWRTLPSAVSEAGRSLCLDQTRAAPQDMIEVFQRRDAGRPIWLIGGPETWLRWQATITDWDVTCIAYDGPADAFWPFALPCPPPAGAA